MASARPVGRFPKAQRVRKRSEFQDIQGRALRVTSDGFVFLLSAREDDGPARLGVTASRKVGGSVTRSRAKRLIREAFRATRDLWPRGIDVVIVARRDPGEQKLADVVAEWRSCSRRIGRRAAEAHSRRDTNEPEKSG